MHRIEVRRLVEIELDEAADLTHVTSVRTQALLKFEQIRSSLHMSIDRNNLDQRWGDSIQPV
jgi:hypothetical protein